MPIKQESKAVFGLSYFLLTGFIPNENTILLIFYTYIQQLLFIYTTIYRCSYYLIFRLSPDGSRRANSQLSGLSFPQYPFISKSGSSMHCNIFHKSYIPYFPCLQNSNKNLLLSALLISFLEMLPHYILIRNCV